MKPDKMIIGKGEFLGALSAAIITLPMSIAYGITAFASLGADFRPHAALIGLNAAIFGGFFASLLGGTPTQISGPKAPLTLLMTTVIAGLIANPIFADASVHPEPIIVALASMIVLIGGMTQVLSGMLGLGNIVKYIPHPVVAGFMNGIAILLIWNQLLPLLGLGRDDSLMQIFINIKTINGFAVLIGTCTLIAIFFSKRYIKQIPSLLSGLLIGTAVFFILSFTTVRGNPRINLIG